ncbi:MAG: hypothetical protein HKN39_02455 [Flavobacteriales bacterium]|nr:hypothetical protein [Flavobacteriales bacterium]
MKNKQKISAVKKNVCEHGWQTVDLRNCGLDEIPQYLFDYPEIVSIDLGNDEWIDDERKNKVKILPKEINRIKSLVRLNLENNHVSNVATGLSKLKNLNYLNLKNNLLSEIAEQIANMDNLKEINLADNPFEMLPPEIIARGLESIRNFYKELKVQDFIYEVKLIIVGEGRVGKTCISKALIDENYSLEEEASTEGINIDKWIIPVEEIKKINPNISRDFQINVWDFGGQEIYHSTHQFFLTKRSIYLLVTESRKEDSHDDFFYWLNIIKLLGDSSPVMMAMNKCDQPTKELPVKEYKSNFSNIVSFDKISLKSKFKPTFLKFKDSLKAIASNLPHIGNPLPKVWVDIRRDIEDLKNGGFDHISKERYLSICKSHFRDEESALFLSEYFHDLGVIIHFQEDVELQDLVVLNHEWITTGVYKILDDRQVISNRGRFTSNDILRIWSGKEYKNKIKELLSLMKNNKFDLCFQLSDNEYLVPRLLPVDEIDYSWNKTEDTSKFEFRYKFMPKGILARLIVKMNSDILNNCYWRYGVMLKYEDTSALIRERYFENRITVELDGENKREFLYLIRKTINEIHRDFNNLEVEEMVPCNCPVCTSGDSPHFYRFNLLRRFESNNITQTRCEISLLEVSVLELTSDISKKALSQEKVVVCENKTAGLLLRLGLEHLTFFPESDSSSVFIKVKTNPDKYGLRDRDFLLDSEIEKIKKKYSNYFILEYYCIENYLYHPQNIEELNLDGFNISVYENEIIKQKNEEKNSIISNFKMARKSYQEFKVQLEKLEDKSNEMKIVEYLDSDDLEMFFKAYSMKDRFDKSILENYQLTDSELSGTSWFIDRMNKIFNLE